MSITDEGTQSIYLKYRVDATAEELNKYLYKILKPGIYEGGLVSIVSGDDVSIASFAALFETSSGQIVRVSTLLPISYTISETKPYLVMNFPWNNSLTNYLDISNKALGEILANDVVFAKGTYVASVLTSIDYSNKTWGHLIRGNDSIARTVYANGDDGSGKDDMVGLTNVVENSLSSGVGTIKLTGMGTTQNSAGFIKMYVNGVAVYVPYFTDIAGS